MTLNDCGRFGGTIRIVEIHVCVAAFGCNIASLFVLRCLFPPPNMPNSSEQKTESSLTEFAG